VAPHFVLLLCAGLAVALPAAALAQSAGDEQYVDPFQEEPQRGDQVGSGGGGGGAGTGGGGGSEGTGGGSQGTQTGTDTGSTGETTGTTGTPPPAPTDTGGDGTATAGTTSSGPGSAVLPVTGPPAVVPILLLGAGLLAGGLALRREA
jgi:hypothetical protein